MITAYQMAVNNVARFIRSKANQEAANRPSGSTALTAFDASVVLGAAFCKSTSDVIFDLVMAEADQLAPGDF